MGYGSLTADNGFFVQGSAGGGSGQINANRNVSMMATNYNALIYTANLAANALVGWGNHAKDAIGYEAGLGVNYMGMHNLALTTKVAYLPTNCPPMPPIIIPSPPPSADQPVFPLRHRVLIGGLSPA